MNAVVRIALWANDQAPVGGGKFEAANAFVTIHRPDQANGAAVVICPGGGYGGLAIEPEGHGIAQWLNRYGITGVVLEYRMPQGNSFIPLCDAQRAMRLVRSNARAWACDPNRIGILGFSAGGHLASTAGTHFDRGNPAAPDPVERVGCRPDFMILIYPVITMGAKTHPGTRQGLLGPDPAPAAVTWFSNEEQVTDQTPPAFLAHARDDGAVSADNSRMFHAALQARKVAAEYLELPYGDHGLNGYRGPMWDAWQTASLKWLEAQGIIPRRDKRQQL